MRLNPFTLITLHYYYYYTSGCHLANAFPCVDYFPLREHLLTQLILNHC